MRKKTLMCPFMIATLITGVISCSKNQEQQSYERSPASTTEPIPKTNIYLEHPKDPTEKCQDKIGPTCS